MLRKPEINGLEKNKKMTVSEIYIHFPVSMV